MEHAQNDQREQAVHVWMCVCACHPDDSAVKRGDGHTVRDESNRSGTLESFQYGICEGEKKMMIDHL